MHRTWALQTVNWSTTVPGWLASMITTLLVVRVLVRIHTRLEVASVSGGSFACQHRRQGWCLSVGDSSSHMEARSLEDLALPVALGAMTILPCSQDGKHSELHFVSRSLAHVISLP